MMFALNLRIWRGPETKGNRHTPKRRLFGYHVVYIY